MLAGGRVAETHPVHDVGHFDAELEGNSMLEVNVAEQRSIHILETRPGQGVACHVAIGAARADAAYCTRAVGYERSASKVRLVAYAVEPLRHHAGWALAGGAAYTAAVRIELGARRPGLTFGALPVLHCQSYCWIPWTP